MTVILVVVATALAQDPGFDVTQFMSEGEFVIDATVVGQKANQIWLLAGDSAPMQEYCVTTLQVDRAIVGVATSGYVDLWASCGRHHLGDRVWMVATRFRGWASGLPPITAPEADWPPADDAVVPASFALELKPLPDGDWEAPALGVGLCLVADSVGKVWLDHGCPVEAIRGQAALDLLEQIAVDKVVPRVVPGSMP